MGKVKISKKLEKPSEHAAVKLIPSFCFKVVSLVIQYSLKYIILLLTFFGEFRRLYAVSTRRFSGGLSYDYLQKDMGNLSKLPRHMTFVINEDVPTDYSDIANLIIWTIAMGIPYITLYDPHGILKAGESRLGKIVKEKISSLFKKSGPANIDIMIRNGTTKFENGIVYPKTVSVQLMSGEDGKHDIVDTAIKLASSYRDRKICLEDLDINFVDKNLAASKNTPDPDLAVQFGPTSSLSGYLPWQSRLTEILHFPTHRNITYDAFLEFLTKYSKCNQRFGK